MKNAQFKALDVVNACKQKLGVRFRGGRERTGWFRLQRKKIARITVPKGRGSLRKGTYQSMARQLFLTISEFDALLDCSLHYADYIKILDSRGKFDRDTVSNAKT